MVHRITVSNSILDTNQSHLHLDSTKYFKAHLSAQCTDVYTTQTQTTELPESCFSKATGPRGRRPGISVVTGSWNRPGGDTFVTNAESRSLYDLLNGHTACQPVVTSVAGVYVCLVCCLLPSRELHYTIKTSVLGCTTRSSNFLATTLKATNTSNKSECFQDTQIKNVDETL